MIEERTRQRERRSSQSDRDGAGIPFVLVSESPVHTPPGTESAGLVAADARRPGPILSSRSGRAV